MEKSKHCNIVGGSLMEKSKHCNIVGGGSYGKKQTL